MNLRTYQIKSKELALENGLYAQVVIIRRTESDYKREKDKTKKTSKDTQKEKNIGSILIMSG